MSNEVKSNLFTSMVDIEKLNKIEKLYKNLDKHYEFEVMFFNYKHSKYNNNAMSFEHFLKVLEYMKYRSSASKLDLENAVTLDVIYNNKQSEETFRITVNDINNVNKYMEMLHNRRNHVIFSSLARMVSDPNKKEITIIKKKKNQENIVDIDDFNVRFRLAEEGFVEGDVLEKLSTLDETNINNILFRSKHRVSLILVSNDDIHIRIDLTTTQQDTNINKLYKSYQRYELEIDITSNKTPNITYMDTIYKEINTLLKVLQQSNYIMPYSYAEKILQEYSTLLNVNLDKNKNLEGRRAQSLEVQHVIEQLPNKYAVTDKADGERYFLIIYEGTVYLISYNLDVKNTGIKVDSKYNRTIFDGEYIFLQNKNRHLFMAFDCLYASGKDVRDEATFINRLKYADNIINECFVSKGQQGFVINDYTDSNYDINNIMSFHSNQINKYMKSLYNDIDVNKQILLIRRKYFVPVHGFKDNEIFKYSELLWKKYIFDNNTMAPYVLDGLMYHPLDQKYTTSVKDSKYIEYKWKPPTKNSIDFYIEFEKNRDTGEILTLYDNSDEDFIKGKPYRIALLYNGKKLGNVEQPVLFQQDMGKHKAYLFLEDGQIRDSEGYGVQDYTVVEFSYNNDLTIPDKYRWVPLRTRHDKTESVRRYGARYGNYYDTALKVWRSICNPVLFEDIQSLANDATYTKHINVLRNKIDHSVILSEYKENIYQKIRKALANPMINFHNFIYSIFIYTYCNPVYDNEKQYNVLDLNCSKGTELMRYYYTRVNMYVGLDSDYNRIISPTDGAISRYNQLKSRHPNFPSMFFAHANPESLLNYDEQLRILGTMTDKNKTIINKFFSLDPKKRMQFDRIVCLTSFSNFLINDVVWKNFTQNINMYLKPDGYLLFVTMDAEYIVNTLKDKSSHASYYTNQSGEKKVLFDIVKKYGESNDKYYGLGNQIDVHNSLVSQEDVYITEYLVDKRFITKELDEKCNLSLEDSGLYSTQYNIHKKYFEEIVKYEENVKTKEFLLKASKYYDTTNDVNNACYEMSKLYRYYAFRKRTSEKITKNVMTGGLDSDLIEVESLLDPSKYIKREFNSNYTFLNSIHDVLAHSNVIPKNTSFKEFFDDIQYKLCKDKNIKDKHITSLCKSLVVDHQVTDDSVSDTDDVAVKKKEVNALDGLNIIIIEKDCDNEIYVEPYSKLGNSIDKKSPTVLLYKQNDKYYPIYKKREDAVEGMFNSRIRLIKRLVNQNN